jgi:hypothetical protein
MSYVLVVIERTSSFTIAPNYPITWMLNDQYLTMNPTKNNILPTYLGNYGLYYVSNNNIPNPWTIFLILITQ